MRQKENI